MLQRSDMELRTDQLDYDLPPHLIATRPCDRRDEARLMVLQRSEPGRIEHQSIRDLPQLLQTGDLLVTNGTRVIPARLLARRIDTGGKVEGLYLDSIGHSEWSVMLKSNGRLRPGQQIALLDAEDQLSDIILTLGTKTGTTWTAQLETSLSTKAVLEQIGRTPLPPYILRRRRELDNVDPSWSDANDRSAYQTIFADQPGAVAAPTAGLHFTPELLTELKRRDIQQTQVTLHVGAGTFAPVESEFVHDHPMHSEQFEIGIEALSQILRTRAGSGRIVAVGTTVVRTLESLPDPLPDQAVRQATNLLIKPGYQFKHVDLLLTNFHLPRSTLLALVAAMIGLEPLLAAYETAIAEEYRFYSYGDAMLILP